MVIKNESLVVNIGAKGAELQSLKRLADGHEYLWNANPDFWGKTSPILFPIVGALKDGRYTFNGKEYQLPRHGFARDLMFDEQKISDSEVVFTLHDAPETRLVYPFSFHLSIGYKLEGDSLRCTYTVFNPDSENTLYFSIGGHPAFAASHGQGKVAYEDFFLEFPADEVLHCNAIHDNLITEDIRTIPLHNHRLSLSHELFYQDALVLKGLKSKVITLGNHMDGRGINFRHESFPYFGIWAAQNADFVCLEPWCGIADHVGHSGDFEMKVGIESLGPTASWTRCWEVDCL